MTQTKCILKQELLIKLHKKIWLSLIQTRQQISWVSNSASGIHTDELTDRQRYTDINIQGGNTGFQKMKKNHIDTLVLMSFRLKRNIKSNFTNLVF